VPKEYHERLYVKILKEGKESSLEIMNNHKVGGIKYTRKELLEL